MKNMRERSHCRRGLIASGHPALKFSRQTLACARHGVQTMGGKSIFVSGHAGARDWARRRGFDAEQVAHLDVSTVEPGDVVLGTLPVHLAAEVCARGGRYLHLILELKPEDRRRELSADDMERLGARLEEFDVRRKG